MKGKNSFYEKCYYVNFIFRPFLKIVEGTGVMAKQQAKPPTVTFTSHMGPGQSPGCFASDPATYSSAWVKQQTAGCGIWISAPEGDLEEAKGFQL